MNKNVNLLEDKVTKFGGQVFPKFGWCCILAGGAGSGKGYNFNKYVPIEGRKFDPDAVKEKTIKKIRIVDNDLGARLIYTDSNGEHVIDLDDAGITPPYNTTNAKFTGLIHQIARPLTKKLKNYIFKGTGATLDRLPNVIFDCTMSDETDYDIIIPQMKKLGYKIAIVYILTNIDVAIKQNRDRGTSTTYDSKGVAHFGRRVDYKTLLDTHDGFIKTLSKIKNRTDIIQMVDDVWAIITSRDSAPQIISIKDGDSLDFTEINNFIDNDYRTINDLQREYDMADDTSVYNEGKVVIGAYSLYEALRDMKTLRK